jgi:hypothetical protein
LTVNVANLYNLKHSRLLADNISVFGRHETYAERVNNPGDLLAAEVPMV